MNEPRGFAKLSVAEREVMASRGGKAAHAAGTAHKWTSEEAKAVGRLGGLQSGKRRQAKSVAA